MHYTYLFYKHALQPYLENFGLQKQIGQEKQEFYIRNVNVTKKSCVGVSISTEIEENCKIDTDVSWETNKNDRETTNEVKIEGKVTWNF